MHQDGCFDSRDAAQTIADLLGVSRRSASRPPDATSPQRERRSLLARNR
ncbi:hypothetical protein [Streptomyces canus]|nr:hypothetical protein [Streptomyces canus]